MTAGQAIAFFLFAVVAAITPGPSNVLLTTTGASVGVLRGLRCLFGVGIGVGLLMFTVSFGLGSLVLGNPLILQGLKWFGVGFLLWMAWKIAAPHPSHATSETGYVGFWSAAAFQWVNPKMWLVAASATGTYFQTAAGRAFEQSLYFGLLFGLAGLLGSLFWLVLGAASQRLLRTERALRVFNVTMGVLLAGCVVLVIW